MICPNAGEPWRWKVVGFRPSHALPLLDGPVTHVDAERITPLLLRQTLLDCEVGTHDQVLAELKLYLRCWGPFLRTGHDHFECPAYPAGLPTRGLYLRLRPGGQRTYPYPYPHPSRPPSLWSRLKSTMVGNRGGRLLRQVMQVEALEDYEHRKAEQARSGSSMSSEEHYREKLAIKARLMRNPDYSQELPGTQPLNQSDLWLLEKSMAVYRRAHERGEPY